MKWICICDVAFRYIFLSQAVSRNQENIPLSIHNTTINDTGDYD